VKAKRDRKRNAGTIPFIRKCKTVFIIYKLTTGFSVCKGKINLLVAGRPGVISLRTKG